MNKKPKFVKREIIKKPAVKPAVDAPKAKKGLQHLRGMHDILPKDEKYWSAIYHSAEKLAEYYQFSRVETPLLEEASLFIRGMGRGTDVIEKEMYVFEDRDGTRVALRPEYTASLIRAYIQHGLWNAAQPIKTWSWGPVFRHDRPQAGRFRQFYQFNLETIGVKDSAADAELILVAHTLFQDLGLPVELRINTLGNKEDRARYLNELTNYYRSKRAYLCEDCKARLAKNPLRLLDCKEEGCQPVKAAAPQITDWLDESSKNFFMKVLEYLEDLGVPYVLTPTLVRGLDYYTHTVFEFYQTGNDNSQGALCGGGRYDLLVEELGGPATPSSGICFGVERIVAALKHYSEKNKINPAEGGVNPAAGGVNVPEKIYDIFFAQLGEEGKRRALKMISELRGAGIKMCFNLFRGSLKSQLETANALKVPYVLILGQKEVQDKTIIVRDMESGVQEIVDQKKIENIIKKKLADRLPA